MHDSTGVPQKIKHRTTMRCSSHTPGPIPQRTGHHLASGHLRSQQHCTQSLTLRPPGVHQPPPMTGRTKRSCYPVDRRKDDLTPATPRVNPEDITLRDVRRHQTQILCGLPCMRCNSSQVRTQRAGRGASGWGRGGGLALYGTESQRILEAGGGTATGWMSLPPLSGLFSNG